MWNVNHYTPDGSHWWNVRMDAVTGQELDRNDWVSQCAFDGTPSSDVAAMRPKVHRHLPCTERLQCVSPAGGKPQPRSPCDPQRAMDGLEASLHLTAGMTRTERSAPNTPYTRGNNVRAQEDANGNNSRAPAPPVQRWILTTP